MRSKRYQKDKQIVKNNTYSIEEAVKTLQELSKVKFDESLDLAIKLNLKRQKEQFVIRGTVELPHFQAKKQRVVALISDDEKGQKKDIEKAGADLVGGTELTAKIAKENKLDADVVIASPKFMPQLSKIARILGPKGLMPNPKAGTISADLVSLVKKIQAGNSIEVRNDKSGNIHAKIGNVSQKAEELIKNYKTVLDFIRKQKPESWKGEYILKIVLSSTMGPGVRVM